MSSKDKNVEKKVEKKQGFVVKTKRFFRSSWNELKKVHWPNRTQLVTYTGVVLVTVTIVSTLIWIVDSGLSFIMKLLI